MTLYDFQREHDINETVIFDGKIHRYKKHNQKGKNSWYIAFSHYDKDKEYQYVMAGDWTIGDERSVWKSYEHTDFDETFHEKIKSAQEKAEQEKREANAEAKNKAESIWNATKEYDPLQNPYMVKKKLTKTYGSKYYSGNKAKYIVIPRRNKDGQIVSLQRIFDDGTKRFLKDGEVIGTFFTINPAKNPGKIYICEGFATGASCAEVLTEPIVVAFSSSNLEPVLIATRSRFPDAEIIILADNDQFTVVTKKDGTVFPLNTGLFAAERLHKNYGTKYFFPKFKSDSGKPTDFNDLYVTEGVEELKTQLTISCAEKYPSMADGFYTNVPPKSGNGEGRWMPDYHGMSKYVKEELHLKNDDSYRVIYKDGFYQKLSSTGLDNLILKLAKHRANPTSMGNFRKMATAACHKKREDLKPPVGMLNLKNMVLDTVAGELYPQTPKNYFTYKLDHDYDALAKCPEFDKFLRFIFDENQDMIHLVGEIMGYTLMGGEPFKHRAFMFFGGGRNGKSTLLDVIINILGENNVSAVSMKMIDKPFSAVRLDGKLANIVEESPTSIDPESFKNIVGGGYVSAAFKNKDEFDLKVNARMFFACNDFPHFKDSTIAIKDRLIILPFLKYIPESERDTDIGVKLKKETSGILNFALDGLRRFKNQGNGFAKVAVADEAMTEYLTETDSVASWVNENIEYNENIELFASINNLYAAYRETTIHDGMKPVAKNTFSKRLRVSIKESDDRVCRRSCEGKRVWGYAALICRDARYSMTQVDLVQ